ncbi:hypothetical protein PQQ50_13680 [Paraburkholderia graminis]
MNSLIVSTLPAILTLCYALGDLLVFGEHVECFVHDRDVGKIN